MSSCLIFFYFFFQMSISRVSFFEKTQQQLATFKSWDSLKKGSQLLADQIFEYPLPHLPPDTKHQWYLPIDYGSQQLYPSDVPALLPRHIFGDGNCMYRAVSQHMFNTEEYHPELRVRTVIELVQNESTYMSIEKLDIMTPNLKRSDLRDYIILNSSSLTTDQDYVDMLGSYRTEVLATTQLGQYSSLLQLYGISNAVNLPIRSVWPKVKNVTVDRNVYNNVINPMTAILPGYVPCNAVSLMWTRTGANRQDVFLKHWTPNHFSLCTEQADEPDDPLHSDGESCLSEISDGEFDCRMELLQQEQFGKCNLF